MHWCTAAFSISCPFSSYFIPGSAVPDSYLQPHLQPASRPARPVLRSNRPGPLDFHAHGPCWLGHLCQRAGDGSETRARSNVWATAALTGAITGLLISTVTPGVLTVIYGDDVNCLSSGSHGSFSFCGTSAGDSCCTTPPNSCGPGLICVSGFCSANCGNSNGGICCPGNWCGNAPGCIAPGQPAATPAARSRCTAATPLCPDAAQASFATHRESAKDAECWASPAAQAAYAISQPFLPLPATPLTSPQAPQAPAAMRNVNRLTLLPGQPGMPGPSSEFHLRPGTVPATCAACGAA